MNQVSDKLGAKMLAGFSMLSTVCPNEECRGTPLCRQGSGPMVCVCCDSEFKVSSLGDLIPTLKTASASETFNGKVTAASVQSVAAVSAPTPGATTFSAPARVNLVATADEILPASEADNAFFLNMQNAPILDLSSFARESENDCSSKIARKLMLGWALLDKCCARKGCKGEVPLMRDLQGTVSSTVILSLIAFVWLCTLVILSSATIRSWFSLFYKYIVFSFVVFLNIGTLCAVWLP